MRRPRAANPLPWLGGLLALYLAAPPAAFVLWTLGHGAAPVDAGQVGSALAVSAATATVATGVVAAFGVPLGHRLARPDRAAAWLSALVHVPLGLPPLASGVLLALLFSPGTALGRLLGRSVVDTPAGIVLAQAFVASPFLVLAARSAFAALPSSIEDAARTLGHGPFARWLSFLLPAAWPGVRAGLVLAWVRAFGEFGATAVVAYHPYSLPILTWVEFGSRGLDAAAPLVGLALAASLAFVGISEALSRRPRATARGGRRRRAARRHHAWPAAGRAWAPAPPARPAHTAPARSRGEAWLAFCFRVRLPGFDLDLGLEARSRRLALLGPSGAGKTLTLRLLSGLARPERGSVRLDGEDLSRLPPERRGIAFVPQDAGLFPTRTVFGNLTSAPGADPPEAARWLAELGLEAAADRRPAELSAGERQRAALGRALLARPRLLLLDEPLSALDAPFREDLRRLLAQVQREAGLATVVVTHDPRDAALLADEIAVLDAGRLLAFGRQPDLFRDPGSGLVARLLGFTNVVKARLRDPATLEVEGWLLPLPPGSAPIASRGDELALHVPPRALRLVPPERLRSTLAAASPAHLVVEVDVRRASPVPGGWEAEVAARPGPVLVVEGEGEPLLARELVGRRALVVLDASRLSLLGPWEPPRPAG